MTCRFQSVKEPPNRQNEHLEILFHKSLLLEEKGDRDSGG